MSPPSPLNLNHDGETLAVLASLATLAVIAARKDDVATLRRTSGDSASSSGSRSAPDSGHGKPTNQ